MPTVAYPITLPVPASLASAAAERRWLSDAQRPRQAAAMQRDRHTFEQVTFAPFNTEQAAAFRAWWRDDLIYGAAWFSAEWPSPRGAVAQMRRFVGAPQWEFVPGGFWRISALCEVIPYTPVFVDTDPCWDEVICLFPFDEPAGTDGNDAIDYGPGGLSVTGLGTSPDPLIVHSTVNGPGDLFDGSPSLRMSNQGISNFSVGFTIDARVPTSLHLWYEDLTFEMYWKRISGNNFTASPLIIECSATPASPSGTPVFSWSAANYSTPNQIQIRHLSGFVDYIPSQFSGYAYGSDWTHFAIDAPASAAWNSARTATLYIDGVANGTFPMSPPYLDGSYFYFSFVYQGYGLDSGMQADVRYSNFRVTKCRRYTANFTPAYRQFPRQ